MIMKSIIKKIDRLKTNKQYDTYLLCYNNIDHIINRCSYDLHLSKFINKCYKYNIKLYFKDDNDNLFCFLNDKNVVSQIIQLKNKYVLDHIKKLSILINKNEDISTDEYVSLNNNCINSNKKILDSLNKLIELAGIIYQYRLLELEPITIYQDIDANSEYNNLVSLSNLFSKSEYSNNGVIIIDQYSS
jgi:hypothetical protein